jgi:hypothetical protein
MDEEYLDADAILAPRADTTTGWPEDDVHVARLGKVRVRGLSRAEVVVQRKKTDEESLDGPRILALERNMLALAMLRPAMTEAQIGAWQKIPGASTEIDTVMQKAQQLSGLAEGAPKSGVAGDGDGAGG